LEEEATNLKGFDLLDFIDQCLQELDGENIPDKEGHKSFKTVAKLGVGMRRTTSEKVKKNSERFHAESGKVIISGRVGRSKSVKSKLNRAKTRGSTGDSSESERLGSMADDDVFNADTRRSTLGEIDVSILDEDNPKPRLDFKTLAMATSLMLNEDEEIKDTVEPTKKFDFKMLAKLTGRIQVEGGEAKVLSKEERKKVWKSQSQNNVITKKAMDVMGWDFDDLNREGKTKGTWQTQGSKNVLAKGTMEAMGWSYDPNSDLSKDEQKKAYWLAQSHNNVLVSKTMNAMAVEKKPDPPKEKKKKPKKEKKVFGHQAEKEKEKEKKRLKAEEEEKAEEEATPVPKTPKKKEPKEEAPALAKLLLW
jgi:hypothetical protein